MDVKELGSTGGRIYSAMCAIVAGRNLDNYPPDVVERAKKRLAENGGKIHPDKKKKNGNGRIQEQLELTNRPRGKAVAHEGNWVQMLDIDGFAFYVRKDLLAAYQPKEKLPDDYEAIKKELEELRQWKRNLQGLLKG